MRMNRVMAVLALCLLLGNSAWAQAVDVPADAAQAPDENAVVQAPGEALPGPAEAEAAPAPDPEAEAQRVRELSAALQRFEAALVALESERGPYDMGLIEVLNDYAALQVELGQPAQAADLQERALAITRISYGLYSPQQVDILQSLIDAHIAAAQWELADDRAHLAFYLQKRLHAADSPEYIRALLAYGRFKQQVFSGNRLSRSSLASIRDIQALQGLYTEALATPTPPDTAAEATDPLATPAPLPRSLEAAERFELLHARAVAEFQLAQFAMHDVPLGLNRPVERYISDFVCRDVVGPTGQVVQQCGTVRRENPAWRDWEMQRQMHGERIRSAVNALDDSVRQAQAVLEATPALSAGEQASAPARLQELLAMQQRTERDYRRSRLDW
jgi:hypothetical protein